MTLSTAPLWRTMYDGINADASVIRGLYRPGDLVGYYVAGNSFVWSEADKALFPPGALVGITLTHSYTGPGADVLDVEPGGATPSETAWWIAAKKAGGYDRPTIYCSLAIVPEIRTATGAFILGRDYDLWVADWDGSSTIPYPHIAAKQDQSAGLYDKSVVYDPAWPHRKPVVPVPIQGQPHLGLVSAQCSFVRATGRREVYWWNGHELWHVTDENVYHFMCASGFITTIYEVTEEVLRSLGTIIS